MRGLRLEGNLLEKIFDFRENMRCPDFVKDSAVEEKTEREEKKEGKA